MQKQGTFENVAVFFQNAADSWNVDGKPDTTAFSFFGRAPAELREAAQLCLQLEESFDAQRRAWNHVEAVDASGCGGYGSAKETAQAVSAQAVTTKLNLIAKMSEIENTIVAVWRMGQQSRDDQAARRSEPIRLTGEAIANCWLVLTGNTPPESTNFGDTES